MSRALLGAASRALTSLLAAGALTLGALTLSGCVVPPAPTVSETAAEASYTPVGFDALPGWRDDQPSRALPAFLASCAVMERSPDTPLGGSGLAAELGGTPAKWHAACVAARAVGPGDAAARSFFETYFQPYAIGGGAKPQGLFTGYYEPEVRGARAPGGGDQTPLLGLPTDMVQLDLGAFDPTLKGRHIVGRMDHGSLVPYWDRAAIEAGALNRQRLGLVWLADPIDAFMLQIQGSGRIDLPDGKVVRVSYAGQNGRPYVPIGRVLADRGEIPLEQVTMQSISAWLHSHSAQATEVMNQNPSFVFFREVIGIRPEDGPPGALGVALTPGRSAAVDRAYIPLGAPLWIDTTEPVAGAKFQRLMLAQDIGGAIKGPVRADIFWGWGKEAEDRAGKMNAPGRAVVLLPRPTAQ